VRRKIEIAVCNSVAAAIEGREFKNPRLVKKKSPIRTR
jgi:hypothetical protein